MGGTLIKTYSKCGSVDSTQKVFDAMSSRVVSLNSFITCYEQNGPTFEALHVFTWMMNFRIEPYEVTLASLVSACASLANLNLGREIHNRVVKGLE